MIDSQRLDWLSVVNDMTLGWLSAPLGRLGRLDEWLFAVIGSVATLAKMNHQLRSEIRC